MPIGWMWSLRYALIGPGTAATWNQSCESAFAAPSTHSGELKNDRCGLSRLSKIAHLLIRLRRRCAETLSTGRRFICPDTGSTEAALGDYRQRPTVWRASAPRNTQIPAHTSNIPDTSAS